MLAIGYVPNDFSGGISIHTVKDNSIKGVQKIDNFRRITLSSIMSKIFQHGILFKYIN